MMGRSEQKKAAAQFIASDIVVPREFTVAAQNIFQRAIAAVRKRLAPAAAPHETQPESWSPTMARDIAVRRVVAQKETEDRAQSAAKHHVKPALTQNTAEAQERMTTAAWQQTMAAGAEELGARKLSDRQVQKPKPQLRP
jgi:hypothetical protein